MKMPTISTIYRSNRSGEEYEIIDVIDSFIEGEPEGPGVVIYKSVHTALRFSRVTSDFYENFSPVSL